MQTLLLLTIGFSAFAALVYLSIPMFRHGDQLSFREQFIRVLGMAVLFTIVFFFVALNLDDLSDLDTKSTYLAYYVFSGLGAWGFLRLVQIMIRRVSRFDLVQLLEFVAILIGALGGALLANVFNHFLWDDTLVWQAKGIYALMIIDFYVILIFAAMVAFMRILGNVQDLGFRRDEAVRSQEMEALRASTDRARLQAIQARLNPHFLYNALNSLASHVHAAPDKAEQMSLDLARMFRELLNRDEQGAVSVPEAFSTLQTYLNIEKARFGDALSYHIDAESGSETWNIPRFLLQPIVENAVLHAHPENNPLEIRVSATIEDQNLMLTVRDNGGAFPEPMSGGFGLQSVSETLELLYPGNYSLDFVNPPQKSVRIILKTKQPRL